MFHSKKKARSRRYLAETIRDVANADGLALHENAPAQAESLLHSLEQVARDNGPDVNSDKIEFMSLIKMLPFPH